MSRTHTITVRIEVDDEQVDPEAIAHDVETGIYYLADKGELLYDIESTEVNPEQDRWAF